MTEKRFTLNQSYLNSKWYYVYDESADFQFPTLTEGESEIFCEALNTLHDENKELKTEVKELRNEVKNLCGIIKSLGYDNDNFSEWLVRS